MQVRVRVSNGTEKRERERETATVRHALLPRDCNDCCRRKTRRTYDESSESLHALQKDGDDAYRLEALDELSMNLSVLNESLLTDDACRFEAFDFGRRMAVEREYRASPEACIHI